VSTTDLSTLPPPAVPPTATTATAAAPAAAPGSRRTPRRPLTRDEENIALASSVMIMIALVATWMVAQLLVLGHLSEARSQTLLYDNFRTQLASAVAPVSAMDPLDPEHILEPGSPVAVLTAPAIDLQQVVVEGTASGDMLAGPGHRRDTVLPGQEGISLVYGRGSTYAGPFGRIAELKKGDTISAVIGQGKLTFTVLGVRRAGDPMPAAPAAGTARLVLTSAESSLGGLAPGKTVYVDADAAKAYPAPAGRPAAVPESEKAMAWDPGAFPLLALCLAGLVAVTLGVIAARQRWSTALVWVIATPIVLALSWGTTDVVMRLLPNLI